MALGIRQDGRQVPRQGRASNDNTQRYQFLFFGGDNGGLDELRELFPDAESSTGGQVGLRSFLDSDNSSTDILGGDFTVSSTPVLDLARLTQEAFRDSMRQAVWGDFRDFTANEDVTAGYVMTELNFGLA